MSWIWTILLALLFSGGLNAQSIGLVGDFTGWGSNPDVAMSSTDNVSFTLNNYTFASNAMLKFRQNSDWATNWGGTFPSGTGAPGGADISVPAGTYNISFNLSTLAFSFNTTVSTLNIGIVGQLTNWGGDPDIAMTSTDGINYYKYDYTFPSGDVKFRQDAAWTNSWGAASFPSGTATAGGSNIPVTAGRYDVAFNINTLAYSFSTMSVSIIGSGAQGWGTDVNMTTTNGINYTYNGLTLINGEVKFRKTGDWGTSWGSTAWPAGVASSGGSNIPTTAGTYNVSFNRVTGAFAFQDPNAGIVTINGTANNTGAAIEMITTDNTNYTLTDQQLVAGDIAFYTNNTNYSSSGFPSGTGVAGSATMIPVVAGHYNVSFNASTFAYNFAYTPISMIGDGAAGWGTDVQMTSTDGGNTYSLSNYFLSTGYVKFRSNSAWTTSWGSTAWPSGTGTLGGDNIPTSAGTYDITFNRNTGAYSFTLVATNYDNIGLIGNFNSWAASVPMVTPDGNTYTLSDYYFSAGGLKFRLNDSWSTNWGGTSFPSGDAVVNGDNIPTTSGYYTVTFVNNTTPKTYNFTQSTVSIIGDAASGWSTDVPMTSTDGGVTFTLNNYSLNNGPLKFRVNNSWVLNYGGTYGASGTAVLNGGNFNVPAGSYNITFNRQTLAFAFAQNTYYADVDGDGYGNEFSSLLAAVQPTGYVTNSLDCNDNTAAISPDVSEVCNGQDDDCNDLVDEGFATSNYYADLDGDGYGFGAATVACQSPGAGYVTNVLDCDDENDNINPEGEEVCGNGIDDDCLNGDLVCPVVGPAYAVSVANIGQFGTGSQSTTSVNLVTAGDSPQNSGSGNDRWYSFTAAANAIRIALNGSTSAADDNEISIYQGPAAVGAMIPLVQENDVHPSAQGQAADGGSETLLYDGLTPGQPYFICIRNANATPGINTMVVSYLNASQSDIGAYTGFTNNFTSTCQNFKVKFRANASGYTIKRWASSNASGTPAWQYSIPNSGTSVASTICQLGRIAPANLGASSATVYVTVDVNYNLKDAFGNTVPMTANGTVVSSFTMSPEQALIVRSSDACPAYKSPTTGTVATNRSVCGTSQYQWEFTQLTPISGLPILENGPVGGSRNLALSLVDGIANGQTYDVKIRSVHADGSQSSFSTNGCVRTFGAAGMPTLENDGAIAERSFNGITASIYPNPNDGNAVALNVNGMEGMLQVKVTDATGKLIQRSQYAVEGSLNTNLNFDHTLSNGLYLVELTNGQQSQTMRMVVNR
jgi:hypothetical protein